MKGNIEEGAQNDKEWIDNKRSGASWVKEGEQRLNRY